MKKNKRNYKFTNEILVLIFVSFSILFSCTDNKNKVEKLKKPISNTLKTGEILAKQYCASCHEFVPPEILPKKYWKNVLSKMSMYFGMNDGSHPSYLNSVLALKRIDSAGIFPKKPLVNEMQWQAIKYYYDSLAPKKLNQGHRPEIDFNLTQFQVKPIKIQNLTQQPTFIKIFQNKIGVGFNLDQQRNELSMMDVNGKEFQKISIPSPLVSMSQVDDKVYLSFMGPFVADDNPAGIIGKIKVDDNFYFKSKLETVLDKRERPIHINLSDFNNDGKQDLLVAEFGKYLGGMYLYFQDDFGIYNKVTLYNGPGAISSIVKDVNNDGLLDVFVLTSQGDEGIYLYMNKGNENFEEKKIINFPAYYGSTHFQIIDFDKDGYDDIIYSNGDSGDFGMPVKPFHGIRFYKNYENKFYKEEWFYPQQGTYKTIVIDFDQDGDFDIASIGFYAYRTIPQESFLYLENLGVQKEGTKFKAYTFKNAARSSFLVMDAGDIDNDGDIDLVLGASSMLMTKIEKEELFKLWKTDGGLITVLENNLN